MTYQTNGALEADWLRVGARQQPVIAADGTLFVAGPPLAIYGPDGSQRWESTQTILAFFPPCLSADGLAYWFVANNVLGAGSRFLALRRDGTTACEYPLPGPLAGPPVLRQDGVLLFTTATGKLQAYRVSAGPEPDAPWPMFRGDARGSSSRSRPAALPPPPADVTLTPFLAKLRVSWQPSFQWETNEIWRASNAQFTDAVLLAAVPPMTLPEPLPRPGQLHHPVARDFFDDVTAEPGKRYYYRVRALNRAGIGPYSRVISGALPDNVSLLWKFTAPEEIYWSAPTVGFDGTVFVRGFFSRVLAVGLDGAQRWQRELQVEGRGPVVVGHDGKLYLSTLRGLRVLSPTGEELRTIEEHLAFLSPAVGLDGTLYVIDGATSVAAYLPDGTLKWRRDLGGRVGLGPVVAQDGSLRVTVNQNLIALNADGTERWATAMPQAVFSGALALTSGGATVLRTADGVLRGIGADGADQWTVPAVEAKVSSTAVDAQGLIYGVLAEQPLASPGATPGSSAVRRRLVTLRADGTEVWSVRLAASQGHPPGVAVAADGTSFVHSATNLIALSPGGQVLWAFEPEPAGPLTAPVLAADGRLFFVAGRTLFALQTASTPSANSWAMAGGDSRGTASLQRPVPPGLRVVLHPSGVNVETTTPVLTALSLLESDDLRRWRIRAHGLPGGEPFKLEIEPLPDQRRFFRAALP